LGGSGSNRRAVLGVGAAGNAWITSAVYSIVTGVIDQHLDPQHAIELPRFLLSFRRGPPGTARGYPVQVESGLAPGAVRRLGVVGDEVQPVSLPGELRMGYAAAVAIAKGIATAAADPRRSGAAGAIGCGKNEAEACQLDSYPR
jgi:gamma-glutamyltranspeptidase